MALVDQELLTLFGAPERYLIISFMCMFCRSLFVLLSFFLLAIVLSVLLEFTDSDYPFSIFKLIIHSAYH